MFKHIVFATRHTFHGSHQFFPQLMQSQIWWNYIQKLWYMSRIYITVWNQQKHQKNVLSSVLIDYITYTEWLNWCPLRQAHEHHYQLHIDKRRHDDDPLAQVWALNYQINVLIPKKCPVHSAIITISINMKTVVYEIFSDDFNCYQ